MNKFYSELKINSYPLNGQFIIISSSITPFIYVSGNPQASPILTITTVKSKMNIFQVELQDEIYSFKNVLGQYIKALPSGEGRLQITKDDESKFNLYNVDNVNFVLMNQSGKVLTLNDIDLNFEDIVIGNNGQMWNLQSYSPKKMFQLENKKQNIILKNQIKFKICQQKGNNRNYLNQINQNILMIKQMQKIRHLKEQQKLRNAYQSQIIKHKKQMEKLLHDQFMLTIKYKLKNIQFH